MYHSITNITARSSPETSRHITHDIWCREHLLTTFTRMIGWTAVVFAIQGWLSETPESKKTASSPAYLSVGMAGEWQHSYCPRWPTFADVFGSAFCGGSECNQNISGEQATDDTFRHISHFSSRLHLAEAVWAVAPKHLRRCRQRRERSTG